MARSQLDSAPSQDDLSLTERELFERLGWFTQIRWLMGGFSLLLLLISWSVFHVRFQGPGGPPALAPPANVVLLIFLYNAVFTFLLHVVRSRRRITRQIIVAIALGQIICDMLAVCGLVHYTGGVVNYFIILILLPLVIAAELLPTRLAYSVAAGAAALIFALAWGEQQGVIPHVLADWPSARGTILADLYRDPLYVLQVTAALTAMMIAIVFIGSTIAGRLREREGELEDAYRQLHGIDEAMGFFMRKAGHEMRAPLAAIYGILDAVTHEARELPDSHQRLMNRAKRRTRALMDLVKDLRRYSWLRSPEGFVKTEPVYFEELVENTVELFRQQAEDGELMLTCNTEPVRIRGDQEMLREVVTNLVANAVQYTPPGGKIEVDLRIQGPRSVLTVADTGIGISDQARQHLFSEFYRAPEAKKHFRDGTGLGLAITRRIVNMHAGEIDVAPGPAGGSVFTVTLPVQPSSRADGP